MVAEGEVRRLDRRRVLTGAALAIEDDMQRARDIGARMHGGVEFFGDSSGIRPELRPIRRCIAGIAIGLNGARRKHDVGNGGCI